MSEKKSNVSSRSNGKRSKVKNFFKNKSKKKEKNKEPTQQSTSVQTHGPIEGTPDAPKILMVTDGEEFDMGRVSDDENDNVSSFLTEDKKKNLRRTKLIQPNVG